MLDKFMQFVYRALDSETSTLVPQLAPTQQLRWGAQATTSYPADARYFILSMMTVAVLLAHSPL